MSTQLYKSAQQYRSPPAQSYLERWHVIWTSDGWPRISWKGWKWWSLWPSLGTQSKSFKPSFSSPMPTTPGLRQLSCTPMWIVETRYLSIPCTKLHTTSPTQISLDQTPPYFFGDSATLAIPLGGQAPCLPQLQVVIAYQRCISPPPSWHHAGGQQRLPLADSLWPRGRYSHALFLNPSPGLRGRLLSC